MTEQSSPPNVTIIVPVYGDWASLEQNILSLLNVINPTSGHKVLFVNDVGSEVDTIENKIKKRIASRDDFEYHRNSKNLGFLQNCNNAVNNLDKTDNDILLLNSDTRVTEGFLEEMLSVLYQDDSHGTVSPRSNNATIASIPYRSVFKYGDRAVEEDMRYSFTVYSEIKDKLPRFYVSPISPGFCILIRRTIIKEFGLFDPIYGKGYAEENDFCMRIRESGYKSTIANHAYVYHYQSRSFTKSTRSQLVAENEKKLKKRYPMYDSLVADFIEELPPEEYFSDAIVNHSRVRVLINILGIDEADYLRIKPQLSLIVETRGDGNIEYVIAADNPRDHRLHGPYLNTEYITGTEIEGIFHLGVTPLGVHDINQARMLEKACYINVMPESTYKPHSILEIDQDIKIAISRAFDRLSSAK